MQRKPIGEFFRRIASVACDPVTRCPPQREIELSAVFAYKSSRREINWSRVTPQFVANTLPAMPLQDVLGTAGLTLTEYPLLCASRGQEDRWGGMRADALYISYDRSAIVMFEAKVDAVFTYGETPPDAQLYRQLEYLLSVKAITKGLVLLCPDFNSDWYFDRLQVCWNAIPEHESLFACLVKWEDVFGIVEENWK